MAVHIVVDKHIVLAGVVPVEPSSVLLHHTFPGNRGCQKRRIQSMVVKALTNELACRHQQHGFLRHNLCHLPYRRFPLLFRHFACQKKRLLRRILQHFIEDRRLIRKSGQNHRRSSCLQCFFHICYNQAIAVFVPPQTLIGMGHRKLFLTEGQHRSCKSWHEVVADSLLCRFFLGRILKAHRAKKHFVDLFQPISTKRRCRHAVNICGMNFL